MMNAKAQVPHTDDPWEDRSIGADEQHVEVAPNIDAAVDAALDLHPISIRLQRNLIDNLKALAQINGLGYQPLIRQILTRWVDSELKQIAMAQARAAHERAAAVEDAPLPTSRRRKAA